MDGAVHSTPTPEAPPSPHVIRSRAEIFASLPREEQEKLTKDWSEEQFQQVLFDWRFWGRNNQFAPDGTWTTWLVLGGRGMGKTRMGAEWVKEQMCGSTPLSAGRMHRLAIVAETAADARDVCVEGPSGILAVHHPDWRPIYKPSNRKLIWPNGAVGFLYNATEPDQLRGPQHDLAWCDELCKWKYADDTWSNLQFGLRLGNHPQQVVTTTPRPIKELKTIMKDPDTVLTRGSTYENRSNLAQSFFNQVIRRYEGTRLGRQELNAEVIDEAEGSLWKREMLEQAQGHGPDSGFSRVVVAIDPAVTSTEQSDETGIVVCARGRDGRGYVLEDVSGRYSPDGWAKKALLIYDKWKADRIVGEVNNGGDMIEHTIKMTAQQMKLDGSRASEHFGYKKVSASRGKQTRAEPISALYEQGRVTHVGSFPDLEDQMCTWEPLGDLKSPDRLDALVWSLTELMLEQKENDFR